MSEVPLYTWPTDVKPAHQNRYIRTPRLLLFADLQKGVCETTLHARVLEMVGPSKGNGTKCPLLRNLKAIRLRRKFTTVPGNGLKTIHPVHHSSTQYFDGRAPAEEMDPSVSSCGLVPGTPTGA